MKQLSDITAFLDQIADAVSMGEQDPLEALGVLRTIASACAEAISEVDPAAIAKAEAQGGKEFSSGGYKFRYSEGRRSWNYDHVDAIKHIQESIKVEQEKAKLAASLVQGAGLPGSGIKMLNGYVVKDGEVIGQPATPVMSKASLTLVGE